MYAFIIVYTNILNMTTTTHNVTKEYIFQEFCMMRNLSTNSIKAYKIALNNYTKSQQETLETLLKEADDEEEQCLRPSKRKLKSRLIQFKIYLQQQKYETQTINDYIHKTRTFYTTYDITTPRIPMNKTKPKETYRDIIKKEDIQKAVRMAKSTKIQAIILFMASSGTAAKETSTLTIQDFIDATSEYHNETEISRVIFTLKNRDDIIPTWNILRVKTQNPYFTFCSCEATRYIIQYLHERLMKEAISQTDKLFNMLPDSIEKNLARLNDKLDFGWKTDHCRYFHTHGLRKFFGTTLLEQGISEMTIDFLEGRSVTKTHQSYYKPRPEKLKSIYLGVLNSITFLEEITYKDINSEEKEELEYYRQKERKMDERIHHLDVLLDEYSRLSSKN